MILNPNKTKSLVVGISRTVIPPHGDMVLSWVFIRPSPNLDILGGKIDSKLTFKDHVRGIVSSVSENEFLSLVDICLWTHLCYFVAIWHLFSQSFSTVFGCGGQLLNVIFSFLSVRCIQWPDLARSEFLILVLSTSCGWARYVVSS